MDSIGQGVISQTWRLGFMAVLRLFFFCIGFPENRLDSVKRRKGRIINNQESTLIISDPRGQKKQNPTHQKIKIRPKRHRLKCVTLPWSTGNSRLRPGPILQPSQTNPPDEDHVSSHIDPRILGGQGGRGEIP